MRYAIFSLLAMALCLPAIGADPVPPKAVVLTAEDREPALLAQQKLIQAQAQYLSLQTQIPELDKTFRAEISKLQAKCGGDIEADTSGRIQCKAKAPEVKPKTN